MWDSGEVAELGQAICEVEYDMDYDTYDDKILKCQPMKEPYDGITVQINGGK